MPHETQPDSGPELSEQLRVAVDYALLEASEGLAAGLRPGALHRHADRGLLRRHGPSRGVRRGGLRVGPLAGVP